MGAGRTEDASYDAVVCGTVALRLLLRLVCSIRDVI